MSCAITEWGPAGWKLLHCAAATYPAKPTTDDRIKMAKFLELYAWALPCKQCGAHFKTLLSSSDAFNPQNDMYNDSDSLFAWVHQAHNRVNSRLNKQQPDLISVRSALYGNTPPATKTMRSKRWLYISLLLAFVFIICLIAWQGHFCGTQ